MALVCYHGDNPHTINQNRANTILNIISDSDYRKIISCVKDTFKTCAQISKETGIPRGTMYRKIHELNEKNVLISSGNTSSIRKREYTYQSKIRKVTMVFENDSMDVQIYTNLRD